MTLIVAYDLRDGNGKRSDRKTGIFSLCGGGLLKGDKPGKILFVVKKAGIISFLLHAGLKNFVLFFGFYSNSQDAKI